MVITVLAKAFAAHKAVLYPLWLLRNMFKLKFIFIFLPEVQPQHNMSVVNKRPRPEN